MNEGDLNYPVRGPSDLASEVDLLAFVEGSTGAIEDAVRRRVATAVATDPALAARLAGMRVDRAGLLTLAAHSGSAGAGADLPQSFLDAVEAGLERDVLARLAAAEPVVTPPAALPRVHRHAVRVNRDGVLATIAQYLRSPSARPALSAAGLALAFGVAYLGVRSAIDSGVFRGDGHHARSNAPSGEPSSPSGTAAGGDRTFVDGGDSTRNTQGVTDDLAGSPLASGQHSGIPTPEPTINEVVSLARAGRLAIVVRSSGEPRQADRMAAWSRSAESLADGQRLAIIETVERDTQAATHSTLLALLPHAPETDPRTGPGTPNPAAPFVAGGDASRTPAPALGPLPPMRDSPSASRNASADILLARIDPAEARLTAALERLLAFLRREDASAARLLVLDRPALPPEPPSTDDLLWWTLPPARWTPPVTVPVIIEPER